MFCVKCGSKLQENELFCTECGAPVNSEVGSYEPEETRTQYVDPTVYSYQQQQQQTAWQQPQDQWQQSASQQTYGYQTQIQEEPPVQPQLIPPHYISRGTNPAPRKKRGLVVVFAVVLVAAVALLGVTQASAFMTFARQTFMEPHEYYQYVEKKEAEKLAEAMTSVYHSMVKETVQQKDQKVSTEMTVQVGEGLAGMLTQSYGMDLSWLESVGIVAESNGNEEVYSTNLALKVKDQTIVTGNVILDMNAERIYMKSQELKDTYLALDLAKLMEESGADIEQTRAAIQKTEEVREALPEKEELEKLINKYASIAVSCITKVEKKKDILYANGVTAECTLLVATVDGETYKSMIKAVCAAIPQDEELKAVVLEVLSLQEDVDAEAAYEEFLLSVAEAAASVDEQEMEGEVELSVWINRKGEIYGRSVELISDYSTYSFSYAFPRDGAKIGMEVKMVTDTESVSLVGSAGLVDGKLTGTARLKRGEGELLVFTLENAEISGKKVVSGAVKIALADVWADSLAGQVPFDLKTTAIRVDFTAKEKESGLGLSLLMEEQLFAGVHVSGKTAKGEAVALPAEGEYVLADEEAAIEEYATNISLEKILENLKNAGMPQELLDMISPALPEEITG